MFGSVTFSYLLYVSGQGLISLLRKTWQFFSNIHLKVLNSRIVPQQMPKGVITFATTAHSVDDVWSIFYSVQVMLWFLSIQNNNATPHSVAYMLQLALNYWFFSLLSIHLLNKLSIQDTPWTGCQSCEGAQKDKQQFTFIFMSVKNHWLA